MLMDFLVADAGWTRSLHRALHLDRHIRSRCSLYAVSSWEEFKARAHGRAFDLAFVQTSFPRSPGHPLTGVRVLERVIGQLAPGSLVPLVCEEDSTQDLLKDLKALGFNIVLIQGLDDHPASLLRAISRARSSFRLIPALVASGRGVDLRTLELVLSLVTGWPPPGSVREAAAQLSMTPRSLRRRLREAGFPSPAHLLRWSRLLEAVALERVGIRSGERLAHLLGLAGHSTLAHLSRDLTNRPLSKTLRPEAEPDILRAFCERLPGYPSRSWPAGRPPPSPCREVARQGL